MDGIREFIKDIPDFPKPGIVFKDINPLIRNPQAFSKVIDELYRRNRDKDIQGVAGMESRGFIFGAPLALKLGVPFILVRKVGKLPGETEGISYELEYGKATVEIQKDSVKKGQRVLIVDDLLATGGTAAATVNLIERLGGVVVNCAFVIELGFLNGRSRLPKEKIDCLISY
ncbi:MAG: adenine phosphoribosyltransferase [Candidatus Dadabacteria bacterium]|nr:adenine phosphoribosyltransferase [Candidatus Dadabacteria bacterium]